MITIRINGVEPTSPAPVLIKVTSGSMVKLSWVQEVLMWLGLSTKNHVFLVYPCSSSTKDAILRLFASIGVKDMNPFAPVEHYRRLVAQHRPIILRIITTGIINKGNRYSKRMERRIEQNFTNPDIMATLFVIIKQMDFEVNTGKSYEAKRV